MPSQWYYPSVIQDPRTKPRPKPSLEPSLEPEPRPSPSPALSYYKRSTKQQTSQHQVQCYGLTSARLCWIAIGWHGVGRRLWDTGQGLEMDCVQPGELFSRRSTRCLYTHHESWMFPPERAWPVWSVCSAWSVPTDHWGQWEQADHLGIKFIQFVLLLSHLSGVRSYVYLLRPNITLPFHGFWSLRILLPSNLIMPKEPSTIRRLRLASRVAASGKVMFLSCAGCCYTGVSCVVDAVSDCCGRCLKKNLNCSLVVSQGDCKYFSVTNSDLCWSVSGDHVDKKKLSIQEELDKTCGEDAELRAEELALIEKSSRLNEKRCTFLSCEFCLCKQLGILGNKEKEMFARELAFIKDLEEQEQAANKTTVAAEIPESTSIVDPFSGLFDLLLPLVLAAFANIPQSSEMPLGWNSL